MGTKKTLILNSEQIEQKINRIAHEIYENNFNEKEVIVAGIEKGGYLFAERLCAVLKKISPIKIKLVSLKIDKENPYGKSGKLELSDKELKDKVILVVDDVLNSGKALIFGVNHFLSTSVKKLNTVVLVDRNHTRYPVKVDYTGTTLSTTLQEHISVELPGKGKDAVYLE